MNPTVLLFAIAALLVVGGAYRLATAENEIGHYWAGLVSGLLAEWTLGIAAFALLKTCAAGAVFIFGLPVAIRIALELGISFSEIVCPSP